MKVTEITSEKKEIEISLPVFRKTGKHFYKVISSDITIRITFQDYYGLPQIDATLPYMAFDGTLECTEEEFLEMYKKAIFQISEVLTNYGK